MCLIQITNNIKYTILARFLEATADIFTPEMLSRSDRILRQSEDQHTPSLMRVYKKNWLKWFIYNLAPNIQKKNTYLVEKVQTFVEMTSTFSIVLIIIPC